MLHVFLPFQFRPKNSFLCHSNRKYNYENTNIHCTSGLTFQWLDFLQQLCHLYKVCGIKMNNVISKITIYTFKMFFWLFASRSSVHLLSCVYLHYVRWTCVSTSQWMGWLPTPTLALMGPSITSVTVLARTWAWLITLSRSHLLIKVSFIRWQTIKFDVSFVLALWTHLKSKTVLRRRLFVLMQTGQ